MVYEELLFNLCKELNDLGIYEENGLNEKLGTKDRFLMILIERSKKLLEEQVDNFNISKIKFKEGVIRFKFKVQDEGFEEIKKLIHFGIFENFARKYCLYLGASHPVGENAYYEIIWDYMTYFEAAKLVSFSESFEDFDKLPIEDQREILKKFKGSVERYRKKQQQVKATRTCAEMGHIFSEWQLNEFVTFEDVVIDHQFVPHYRITSRNWSRDCRRCRFSEVVEVEPEELRAEREAELKRVRIKALEEELRKLQED